MTDHPHGMVAVVAQDTARYSMFAASLTGLNVPPGTTIKWEIGHSIADSLNDVAASFLDLSDGDWLFLLNDDHAFAPGLLGRLLDHEKDIVVPLCYTRVPPYKPVVYSGFADDAGPNVRRRVDLNDHPLGGLIPVHSAGGAGMLIRRRVLEAVERPWFEMGMVASTQMGEDVYFCDKARAAGFGIHADLDARLGHCTTAVVWPAKEPSGWTYGFAFPGGLQLTMPSDAWADADAARAEA
jgi:hypothetical protein